MADISQVWGVGVTVSWRSLTLDLVHNSHMWKGLVGGPKGECVIYDEGVCDGVGDVSGGARAC